MKQNYKKMIGLSVVAMTLIGSSAYAGKIISDANLSNILVEENKQFGFGGWNYDNADVRIVDIADFSTALPGSEFNTTTGFYTPMYAETSFESDIISREDNVTVLGHLHGKDWPVGEPSGIKIINDDMDTSNGKPTNCIMTSSYLETGYLDAYPEVEPVLCSSPWQSHKRYKINLLPTTVAEVDIDGYGKPVDLVFNLDMDDNDTVARRYQVLQKVNNYTDKRLDGYKVEVLDENGSKNAALTLSLGLGEGIDKDTGLPDGSDIWDDNELANYSHGLWGPYQKVANVVRFENGFFDYQRSYYPAQLGENNQTISHIGPMEGGNYQEIFGNWLPSIWAPMGIFHDDDMDPATDGVLKTFFGVAPGETELAWWTRSVVDVDPQDNIVPVYTWAKATEEELTLWQGEWYAKDHVEDVLNLGLNYIIEVGENAKIGSTFILRLTPHVDTNQTPPSSYVAPIASMSTKYSLAATGNFNDDDIADTLWRDSTTGSVVIWYINRNGTHIETEIGASDITVNLEDTADFNNDGIDDVLWRDPVSGLVSIWYMNSDGTYTDQEIAPSGTTFNIAAAADFNNDGIADVLWRDPVSGKTGLWYMASDGSLKWKLISGSGTAFSIAAVADFNNDGIADILWIDPVTGKTGFWYITSDGNRIWKKIAAAGITFNVAAAADFNNDGIADILWRDDSTGNTGLWYIASDGTRTWKLIDTFDTAYDIAAAADFSNDGIADIFWRNSSTGDNLIWYMNSAGSYN